MIHYLKTWPEHFAAVQCAAKLFELRRDDREPRFAVRDTLILQEFVPGSKWKTGQRAGRRRPGRYTGRCLKVCVTYITRETEFGLRRGHCVMGIAKPVALWVTPR